MARSRPVRNLHPCLLLGFGRAGRKNLLQKSTQVFRTFILPRSVHKGMNSRQPGRPLSTQRQSSNWKKSLYPVREPQPVELTAPIIFIEGEERPANTIIIVGFPRTESPVSLTSEVKPSVLSSPGAASRSRALFHPK
jgi:hypothetical protein